MAWMANGPKYALSKGTKPYSAISPQTAEKVLRIRFFTGENEPEPQPEPEGPPGTPPKSSLAKRTISNAYRETAITTGTGIGSTTQHIGSWGVWRAPGADYCGLTLATEAGGTQPVSSPGDPPGMGPFEAHGMGCGFEGGRLQCEGMVDLLDGVCVAKGG